MVRTILLWVLAAILLSLAALWIWQGGFWKIAQYAQIIPDPSTALTDNTFMLPGQPEFPQVPDTTSGSTDYGNYTTGYEHYGNDAPQPGLPQNINESSRSPYAGTILLQPAAAKNSVVRDEYVVIRAAATMQTAVDISGWTLQSALTGERAVIPLAANPFVQGTVNAVRAVLLQPGESVVVSTGASPVGVSFKETSCTGYLAATQQFTPPLANACPRATDLVPRTPQNESYYGARCFNYMERMPPCNSPTTVPDALSSACKNLIANSFTYNGCVTQYERRNIGSWRLYLASGVELWRNSRDVIQLVDRDGKIVDTASY